MATLVLSTAGAAIGGALGGPFGAMAGRMAGALAGAAAGPFHATSLATRGLPMGAVALPIRMAAMSASLGY